MGLYVFLLCGYMDEIGRHNNMLEGDIDGDGDHTNMLGAIWMGMVGIVTC